jgi:hypothetical protein
MEPTKLRSVHAVGTLLPWRLGSVPSISNVRVPRAIGGLQKPGEAP